MIERREELRFPREANQPLRILREGRRQHFQGHVAIEPCVAGAVDLSHAAFAQLTDNLKGPQRRADHG